MATLTAKLFKFQWHTKEASAKLLVIPALILTSSLKDSRTLLSHIGIYSLIQIEMKTTSLKCFTCLCVGHSCESLRNIRKA